VEMEDEEIRTKILKTLREDTGLKKFKIEEG
jgi:hypothetical protein